LAQSHFSRETCSTGSQASCRPGAPDDALVGYAGRLDLPCTPDDIPLSPARLTAEARAVGLEPELLAVTYGWRRLPPGIQSALRPLDALGSPPRAAPFGHTLMPIARAPRR
jgi:hypothetical protein